MKYTTIPARQTRAITIAMAAPSMPRPSVKIMIGSRTIATRPAPMVTDIARQASPSARSTPPPTIPSAISGADGSVIHRNRAATSCVSPCAPASDRSGRSQRRTAATTTTCTTIEMITDEVAWRRACSWLPSPMERLTSALVAMARPMPEPMMKNWIVHAKPSAAISVSSRSCDTQKSVAASIRNMNIRPVAAVSVIVTT